MKSFLEHIAEDKNTPEKIVVKKHPDNGNVFHIQKSKGEHHFYKKHGGEYQHIYTIHANGKGSASNAAGNSTSDTYFKKLIEEYTIELNQEPVKEDAGLSEGRVKELGMDLGKFGGSELSHAEFQKKYGASKAAMGGKDRRAGERRTTGPTNDPNDSRKRNLDRRKPVTEDAVVAGPTNTVGSGAIAGTGGKGGEPGVSRRRKSPVLVTLRRKTPKV